MSDKAVLIGWRKRWNRNLMKFLGRRARTRVDIEDLAQETYLRLLRSASLHEVRNPQAYLMRVASHVVAEWRHSQPPMDELPAGEDALVDESTPEFEMDAAISQERLEQTLQSVSPMMRAVLLLRLRDELPYRQIAQQLEITERQVKRYLVRGYERLRQVMED